MPFKGYFSISLLLPFFTYVKKHSFIIFIFHGRIFNISNISSTWAFSFSQHLKWSRGVLNSAKHWDNRPKLFRHTIQLTKRKFCHQIRAETQNKQGGLSNKGSSGEKGPPCHKPRSHSGWKQSWKVMDGWRQWMMKPTLASQNSGGNDYIYSL